MENLSEFRPIADYGLLSDCNSAALSDRDGSIDWLCLPRFDSSAVFARILDPAAGHWSIRPAKEHEATRALCRGLARDRDLVRRRLRQGTAGGRDGVRSRTARARARARRPARGPSAGAVRLGRARARARARPAPGVRSRDAPVSGHPRRRAHLRGPEPGRRAGGRAGGDRGRDDARAVHAARGRAGGVRDALGRPGDDRSAGDRAGRGGLANRGCDRGMALMGGGPRHLRGAEPRPRAALLAGAQGPHLPADRGDRGGADHLPSRGPGRRAKLGLPLRLGPGLEPDPGGAVGWCLLGRGRELRLLRDRLGRRPRPRRAPAPDHVRDRR